MSMTKEQLFNLAARRVVADNTDPSCPECKWMVCQCPPSKTAVYLARGFFVAAAIFAFSLAGWSLYQFVGMIE